MLFLHTSSSSYVANPARHSSSRNSNPAVNPRQIFAFSALSHLADSYLASPKHAKNVLVLAGSTKVASSLIQLANDLALEFERQASIQESDLSAADFNVPSVHFVFFGPYSVDLDFFVKANGANATLLYVHDGRARLSNRGRSLASDTYRTHEENIAAETVSTFDLAPGAVRTALETTYRYLRPESTIWSPDGETNPEFANQLRGYLGSFDSKWSPIELPAAELDDLQWLAYIGLQGLKKWANREIDIVISVTSHPGSLIRLLESIARAKYYYSTKPRITIYLPPGPSDPSLINYIEHTLGYPQNRIFLQSLLPNPVSQQHSTSKDSIFLSAIRAYVPSSKRASVLILSDTVRLSAYWYHWTMFAMLRFSPAVLDTEMTSNLQQLAGITLCPPIDATQLPHYFLTESKSKLSCTLYFPPHFRVLQSFFAARTTNAQERGVRRTLPVPNELSFLKSQTTSSSYDMREFALPIYLRGYLFLSQLYGAMPAIDDFLIESRLDRLSEQPTELIVTPIYNWILMSGGSASFPLDMSENPLWKNVIIYADYENEANSTLQAISQRGTEFVQFLSPECNVVDKDHPLVKKLNEYIAHRSMSLAEYGIRPHQEEQEDIRGLISKFDDDWSDVFCNLQKADTTDNEAIDQLHEKSERAKSLEEERKEHSGKIILNAANSKTNIHREKAVYAKDNKGTRSSASVDEIASALPAD
ncbi:hypothetical protein V1512DRAFT_211096 [Lipomyces arxii]|uniref:uncharacterized protein n=1 Tax=Lipomyces arxii TaxID=56418 RepID=UPI0034CD52DF